MIKSIQNFFDSNIHQQKEGPPSVHALQLATAALLIEVSKGDFEVTEDERQAIQEALRKSFGLTTKETEEIVALADEELSQSVSIYEFTHLVDRNYTPEQKIHIVGLLWQVAFSDERLQDREEFLVRKIAKLLHVQHRDFINEKIRIKKELGL